MLIKVNKESAQKRFNDVVNDIIEKAKYTANNGQDRFCYQGIRGEAFNTFEVCNKVKELTEGTVYHWRSSGNGVFTFRIKQ